MKFYYLLPSNTVYKLLINCVRRRSAWKQQMSWNLSFGLLIFKSDWFRHFSALHLYRSCILAPSLRYSQSINQSIKKRFIAHNSRANRRRCVVITMCVVLHFLHPPLLHAFTLNSKTYLFGKFFPQFHHRSLTIDTPDWLSPLIGPVFVSTQLTGFKLSSWFGAVRVSLH